MNGDDASDSDLHASALARPKVQPDEEISCEVTRDDKYARSKACRRAAHGANWHNARLTH